VDKNGLASKKLASAHLPLWICRRFSTDDAVLQAFELANLSVCIRIGDQPLSAGRQRSSLRRSRRFHFLPEDKKRSSSVGVCFGCGFLFGFCFAWLR
jgi:hypothetical protein